MQKHVNLVDLVKSFPTNIYLQNLASIQKRTSPVKFALIWLKNQGKVRYRTFQLRCSGDYKKLLVKLSKRNSEEKVEMRPIWWAQRCVDAVYDVEQLKTLLAEVPAVALKRGTEVYEKVYPYVFPTSQKKSLAYFLQSMGGPFSAVSTQKFASKYSFEGS